MVRYQDDYDIIITPSPIIETDKETGNMFALFDLENLNAGRKLEINIKRTFSQDSFGEDMSVRSETKVDKTNEKYTWPEEKIESDNSAIISKANELTDGLSSDYKRAVALFEFVNTKMSYQASKDTNIKGAAATLKSMKGFCLDYATLYAALCRAVNIPCKVIVGSKIEKKITKEPEIVFNNETGTYEKTKQEYEYILTDHAWNEIYFDEYGWVPVDTCVVYVQNGSKTAYMQGFGKVDADSYFAREIYSDKTSVLDSAKWSALNDEKANFTATSHKKEIYEVGTKAVVEPHSFSDMSSYTWAVDAVNTLYARGVIKGISESEFGPSKNISRIDFMCMLSRILKYFGYTAPSKQGRIFYPIDFDKSHYGKDDYEFLLKLYESMEPTYDKFSVGYRALDKYFDTAYFEPNKPITRGEAVALMEPFLKYEADNSSSFNDVTNYRFRSAIYKAFTNGVIKGYEDGSFRPDSSIKRAEAASIFHKWIGGGGEYII